MFIVRTFRNIYLLNRSRPHYFYTSVTDENSTTCRVGKKVKHLTNTRVRGVEENGARFERVQKLSDEKFIEKKNM